MRLLWEPPWRAIRWQNAQRLIRWPYGTPGACLADAVVPPNIATALLAGGMLAFAVAADAAGSGKLDAIQGSMTPAQASNGVAATDPATGTTPTTSAVTRQGSAATAH